MRIECDFFNYIIGKIGFISFKLFNLLNYVQMQGKSLGRNVEFVRKKIKIRISFLFEV